MIKLLIFNPYSKRYRILKGSKLKPIKINYIYIPNTKQKQKLWIEKNGNVYQIKQKFVTKDNIYCFWLDPSLSVVKKHLKQLLINS